MLNRYPLWKYIVLIFVVIIGCIYALPNLYGEDPVIEVTSIKNTSINKTELDKIITILKHNKIPNKSILLKNNFITIHFINTEIQLQAYEAIIKEFNKKNYIVKLNLESSTPNWMNVLGAKPMKLGLDLRGGVHFLMEIDMDSILNELREHNTDIIKNDLHKNNIFFAEIKKIKNYGIKFIFNNTLTRDHAFKVLNSLHYQNTLISSIGVNSLDINITNSHIKKLKENAIKQNIVILRNRVNQLGVSEPLVQTNGSDKIVVELPGIQNTSHAKEILGATAVLEFRLVNTDINQDAITKGNIPNNSEMKMMRNGKKVILYKKVILTGNHIIDSTCTRDEYNQPQVNISLDNFGGKIFSDFSKNNIGKLMATLFVDYRKSEKKDIHGHFILIKHEEVINIASIKSRINDKFRITGIDKFNEAEQLSLLLRAGALVAPIQIVAEQTIGPSMGQENITKGLIACFFSLCVSILFMLLFYKKFGLIASIALLVNLILIIAVMSLLPGATLTMPGIAGIVLTVAVAIDANILINERIKEELRNGFSIQRAINQGYNKAFSSIIDANITTLIKVSILYIVATGSIKGFAITTAIGIMTSMFTAIIGTRAIVNIVYASKRIKKLSI